MIQKIKEFFNQWKIIDREYYEKLLEKEAGYLVLDDKYEDLQSEIILLKDDLNNEKEEDRLNHELLYKYPSKRISWNARSFPFSTEKCKVPLQVLITPNDPYIMKDLNDWGLYKTGEDYETLIPKIYQKIKEKYYKYAFDRNVWGSPEVFEFPFELREKGFTKGFDCVVGDTKIWTEKGLKQIKDISIGDNVLSYDFEKQKLEYKKVLNKWNKGKLKTKELSFFGGYKLVCTEDHKFYFRKNSFGNPIEYVKMSLKDRNFKIHHSKKDGKYKVPSIYKIPYKEIDNTNLSEDICRLIGYYIAEGWGAKNKNGKFICGYEIDKYLAIMEDNDIPFTIQKPNSN